MIFLVIAILDVALLVVCGYFIPIFGSILASNHLGHFDQRLYRSYITGSSTPA
ncbi:MAG: hypothetical protein GY811_27220 [Myxococcales bacterium]|nr:hypothetical protein [Myxococcales bacterium]